MQATDLIIFGVVLGCCAAFPIAIVINFGLQMLKHRKPLERDWTDYP